MNTYRCFFALTVVVLVCLMIAAAAAPASPSALAAPEAGSLTLARHLGGVVNAVYAADDYLLWGKGAGLEVYTPDGANRLGGLMLPHFITDIAVDGSRAYVATNPGLYVVNLANLSAPALLQFLPAPIAPDAEFTWASTVEAKGSVAYVGLVDGGLWVANTAAAAATGRGEAASPGAVNRPDDNWVSELYRSDNHLFSVDNASGIPGQPQVWDISDAADPEFLGKMDAAGNASGVAVVGGYLYISTFYGGMQIYNWDPTQPLSPTHVSTVELPSGAVDVAVSADGQSAFLATQDGQLVYVDVSNKAAPVVKDSIPANVGYYDQITTRGGLVFVAAGVNALHVYGYDTDSLSFRRERGMRGLAAAGALHDGYLFLGQESLGVAKLRLADRTRPVVVDRADTGANVMDVAPAGNWLVAGDGEGIKVLDPGSLEIVGQVDLPEFSGARSLATSSQMVFAAAGEAGACAVSLANPSAPELLSCYPTDDAQDLSLSGGLLYVADGAGGVVVLNIGNGTNMQAIGGFVTQGYALEVAVMGAHLYVSVDDDGDGRLLFLSRDVYGGLEYAGEYDTAGFVSDMSLVGELLFLANQDGLEVLRRLSATSFEPWATYDSAGSAREVVVNGDLAYLMDYGNGLLVLRAAGQGLPPTPTGSAPSPTAPGPTPTEPPEAEPTAIPSATPTTPPATPVPDPGSESRLYLPYVGR